MTHAMTPTIEELARGLTEAQKRAVMSVFQDEKRHAPYHLFRNNKENRAAWRGMIPLGLVSHEDGGYDLVIVRGHIFGMVALTPLGLTLRAYLEKTHG